MHSPNQTLHDERLNRYRIAMANGRPDRIPIRPFVAEAAAKVAGMTCQEVTQDYEKAFEAVRHCANAFDWDAVVPNMVYLWGAIPQVLGSRYYAVPGVGLVPDTRFQYLEPPEGEEWMRRLSGTVKPWPEAKSRLPEIEGDEAVVRKSWEGLDAWAYSFLWHCVVSF